MSEKTFFIAQIGRTVGLHGDLKLHLHTDFPEQFKTGHTFQSSRGPLTVSSVNLERGTIRFVGYESMEGAKKLTNVKLYANQEETRACCRLEKDQYFWFDVLGCTVKEKETILGTVYDIQRMLDLDYLAIKTDPSLVKEGMPKEFLIPYIPRYIVKTEIESKVIFVQDAKEILEAS
ncbi:MAG: ribosome maturation factor RimM [Sulfurovum sp.]|nr:ribosome maturation factor RimM [Sulfurovum sp.]MDD3602105.1 ribosome maturation factor RimM [Sulfurovum sp.]